jgi:hypothetical protein
MEAATIVWVILAFIIYFIPTIIAFIHLKNEPRHKYACGIFCLNLFLGWTILGWIGALVWALCNPNQKESV